MRYYSSAAGAMTLQVAISSGDTSIQVDTTAGLPVLYPYTLVLDYGTASEEVVSVTAAGGTTLTVTRAEDGTIAQSHELGAVIRHGITARDHRESREHEAASTAHGVTGDLVGTEDVQTLDHKTFEPDGDHVALTVRDVSGNTEPPMEVRDNADNQVGTVSEDGISGRRSTGDSLFTIWWGSAANLFKQVFSVQLRSDIHAIVGTFNTGATGRFLRLMDGVTEKFYVSATGSLGAVNGTFTGTISGPTITALEAEIDSVAADVVSLEAADVTLAAADTALDVRVDALEAEVRPLASASKSDKKIHWGTFSGTTDASGLLSVTHGAGFTPSVVLLTSQTSGRVMAAGSLTGTTFNIRAYEFGGSFLASSAISGFYFCGE